MPNIEKLRDARSRAEGCLQIAEQEIEVIREGLSCEPSYGLQDDLARELVAYETLVEKYRARIRWCGAAIDRVAVTA